MREKKYLLLIVMLITIISIALFVISRDKQKDLDQVKVRLRYNHMVQFEEFYHEKWVHSSRFMGFYTAEQKGFYEQYGIQPILTTGGPDFSVLNLLRSGENFWITGVDQVLGLRDKGGKIVILAVLFRKNPFMLVTINKEIKSPQDLIGKKIGLKIPSNSSNSDILFYSMLNNTNIRKEQVEIVPIGFDLLPLLNGEVDAYEVFALDELITLQDMGYEVYIINPADYGVDFYADAIVTTEETIQRNPDIVRRFVAASLKGWNYAYSNPVEALNYTLMYSDNLNREHEYKVIQVVLGLLKPDNHPIGYIDKNILQSMQSILLEKELMKGIRSPLNLTAAYTTKFIGDI